MGTVRPIHLVTAIDVGKALNPAICEGQVEGAVTQSLGYALTEEIVLSPDGRVLNPSFMDYKIFCSADMPKLTTILVEDPGPLDPSAPRAWPRWQSTARPRRSVTRSTTPWAFDCGACP